jgi:hypothetical protein
VRSYLRLPQTRGFQADTAMPGRRNVRLHIANALIEVSQIETIIIPLPVRILIRRIEIPADQRHEEEHAAMSMMRRKGTWHRRLVSREGWIAISHGFVMNWTMLWRDIWSVSSSLEPWALGYRTRLGNFFSSRVTRSAHPFGASSLDLSSLWLHSVGNVPFAAVLWRGGISFDGVIGLIFGDLIIPPILNI